MTGSMAMVMIVRAMRFVLHPAAAACSRRSRLPRPRVHARKPASYAARLAGSDSSS